MTDNMKMRILNETFKDFHHARRRTIGYCSIHVKGVKHVPTTTFAPARTGISSFQGSHVIERTVGARREGRTPTLLREPDFESGASASSAIRAHAVKRL